MLTSDWKERLKKFATTASERRTEEKRVLGRLPDSFQYRFTKDSGFCDIFKRMPKSMQIRLLRLWESNDQPEEMIVQIERWQNGPERYMSMFDIKLVSLEPRIVERKPLDMSYDKFRKFMMQLSQCEL